MGQKTEQQVERLPYVMSEDEITTLLAGMMNFGPEETYERILNRAESATLLGDKGIDSDLMDMHDTLLRKARSYPDIEAYKPSKGTLYHLARIMRRVAYEIRKIYGKSSEDHRFFRLINNPDFPQFKLRE